MIDKIIERLKREKLIAFETLANTGDEKFDFAYLKVGNYADKAIDIVKQATEEGGWIKCSDRLPKFDEPVLVYLKNNTGQETMTVAKYQEFTIRGKHIIGWFTTVDPYGENALHNDCVVAWRPLPEPYKEAD